MEKQVSSIRASQIDFKKFVDSTIDIVQYQYDRGSMRPLVVNTYALDITVSQIEILDNLISEIIW
jgi:hypothetical protein